MFTLSLAFHLPNTQIMIFHIPAVSPGIFKNGYWEKARWQLHFTVFYKTKPENVFILLAMCQESADLFPCQTGKGNSMGQKDISLVRYFEDEDRYADLINGFIFGGERVVSGADIQELDSRITGFLSKIKDGFKIQKYRDSVRKVVLGLGFAIIGLEN